MHTVTMRIGLKNYPNAPTVTKILKIPIGQCLVTSISATGFSLNEINYTLYEDARAHPDGIFAIRPMITQNPDCGYYTP